MKITTEKAIEALLATDKTVNTETAKRALAVLRGRRVPTDEKPDEIISRKDAARMLHIAEATVSRLASAGRIVKITCGGRGKKAIGYTRASILNLIKGGV